MKVKDGDKIVLVATVLIAGVAVTFAGEANASAGLDVMSAYVFRGATVSDEVSFQPYVEGTFYGVTAGTWGNLNTDASQFDEIDYYASYDLPLGECPVGLSVGYTEYTYPTATSENPATGEVSGLEADREVRLSASLDTLLSPSATVSYGIEGPFLNKGIYIELGLEHEFPIGEKVSLTGGATVGYEAGDNVPSEGFSHATFSLAASVGPLTASAHYVLETDDDVLAIDEEFFGGLGIEFPL